MLRLSEICFLSWVLKRSCVCREHSFIKEYSSSIMNNTSYSQKVSLLSIPWQKALDLHLTSSLQVCVVLQLCDKFPQGSCMHPICASHCKLASPAGSIITLAHQRIWMANADCSIAMHGCHDMSQAEGLYALITSDPCLNRQIM